MCKKRHKKLFPYIKGITAAFIVFLFITGKSLCVIAVENNTAEIKKQYDEAVKRKNETQNALKNKEQDIETLKENKKELENKLDALENTLFSIGENIKDLSDQIEAKENVLDDIKKILEKAMAQKEKQYKEMKLRIRYIYERQRYIIQDIVIESGSYSRFLNQASYVEAMSAYDRKKLEEYKALEDEIALQKSVLEDEYKQLLSLKDERDKEKNDYFGMIASTSELIAKKSGGIDDASLEADTMRLQLLQQQAEVDSWEKKLKEQLAISEEAKKGTWANASGLTFHENDLRWLANLIYTEAGNQPYEGQVAVGAVVINRIRSSRFSQNTIEDVIKAPNQFAVWPSRLAVAYEQDWASTKSTTCYNAAKEAMSGSSPVGNALFFCTVEIGPPNGTVIGAHIFY